MNNFTLAHVLSTRRANTCADRLLSSRVVVTVCHPDASSRQRRRRRTISGPSPEHQRIVRVRHVHEGVPNKQKTMQETVHGSRDTRSESNPRTTTEGMTVSVK